MENEFGVGTSASHRRRFLMGRKSSSPPATAKRAKSMLRLQSEADLEPLLKHTPRLNRVLAKATGTCRRNFHPTSSPARSFFCQNDFGNEVAGAVDHIRERAWSTSHHSSSIPRFRPVCRP